MSRLLKLFFCIGLFMNLAAAFCQQEGFINGKLTDQLTKDPVPFATIRIKSKALGLISNGDGGFKIPTTFQQLGDTLVISCIGYSTKEVLLSKLLKNKVNQISLLESALPLDEVVVTSKRRKKLKAKEIVRLAIDKMDENFPTMPFSYVGYYRDYQLKEHAYLNLNEAVLGVFDGGFETEDFKETKISVYKYQKNQEFPRDTISSQPYDYQNRSKVIPKATLSGRIRNEYTRLRLHDALRNHAMYTYSFVDRLDMDLIKNHKFALEDDTFLDGTPLYKVEISKSLDEFKIMGHIYIDKTNYSIHRLVYTIYEKNPPKYFKKAFSNDSTIKQKKRVAGKLLYEIHTEYQHYKDKMYLNYISFSNAFDVLPPPKFKPLTAEIDHDKKRFRLILNNPPLLKDALKTTNYDLYFQERKLRIAKVEVKNNTVFLYPKNAEDVFDPKLIQYFKGITDKGVAIQIKNVSDVYGNVINQSEAINYYQFREFFVQQLSLETPEDFGNSYMIKTKPLDENQPVVPILNLSDYWMNTPLKE